MIDLPGQPERRSLSSRIIRASTAIAVAHIAFKFLGIIQYRAIGQFCTPFTRDLFVFGWEVLWMLFLIGEESLGPAFLPVFMEEKEKRGETAAWRFTKMVLTCQFFFILAATATIFYAPEFLVRIVTAWDEGNKDPAYMMAAPLYARFFVIGIMGMSIGSTTYMLLNGYKRFFLAAFGDAALRLGIIIAVTIAFIAYGDVNGGVALVAFSIGVALGGFLKLGTHLIGLGKKLKLLRGGLDWRNPAFRKFMLLIAPLLFGILFAKVRDLFNNIYVLSYVETGLLANSAWSRKIFQSLGFVIPYAVSIAMLPFFCELVDRDQKKEMGDMVTKSSFIILLICAPLAALVIALSLPISQLLFQGGRFTFQDCLQVAVSNQCYTLVLPAYALEYVFMQAFFSNRKMISVTIIGLIFSSLSMAISYVCVIKMGMTGVEALAAVALALTISKTLKAICLAAVMRRFIPCFPVGRTLGFLARVLVVALGTGGAARGARWIYEALVTVPETGGQMEILMKVGPDLVFSGLAGGGVGLLLILLLCPAEAALIRDWALARFRRKQPSDNKI